MSITEVSTEWECLDCGYLVQAKRPPRRCPDCGSVDTWEKVEYIDDWGDDGDDEDEESDEEE